MRHLRCECGKSLAWDSGSESGYPCQGCDECGTTYATHPGGHQKRIPHVFGKKLHHNGGLSYLRLCERCHHHEPASKEEILAYLEEQKKIVEARYG